MQERIHRRNFAGFIIHALFLALTMNFIDINTVVPNMIGQAGGTALHLGILTAIMIGGTSVMQLFFAGMLMPYPRKKPFLLSGIYLRVAALTALGFFLVRGEAAESVWRIAVILGIMTIFSFSGSFAGIAYMDILGRAIEPERRKRFLMLKQLIASVGVIVSSLLVKAILSLFAYPQNYSLLFLSAGGLLLVGTAGFWVLREPVAQKRKRITIRQRFSAFYQAVVHDRNVRFYLVLINTSGVALSMIPFLMLYGRSKLQIDGSLTGTYLLVQMGAGLATNIILNLVTRNQRYKGILYLFIAIAAAAPVAALLLATTPLRYAAVFVMTGSALALYQVAAPGILLEISNDENRAVYTGLSGAGGIMNIIFPLAAGFLVQQLGYPAVLAATSVTILLGALAARRIVCVRLG